MGFEHFDVFVIGTGTAGKGVAKDCAKAGWKVAIADNREYGGTCPNRGCDPKKVLVGFTEIIDRAQKMKGKGITKTPLVSWSELMAFKETFVDRLANQPYKKTKLGKDFKIEESGCLECDWMHNTFYERDADGNYYEITEPKEFEAPLDYYEKWQYGTRNFLENHY